VADKHTSLPSLIYRFGVFQANLAARELRKHGVRVRLSGQPFCVLSKLLERHGETVTREELRQKLWPAGTFVDFEHSLNTAIKKLRAALGDSPENSRYIETVPRLGYRFVAPVETVSITAPLTADSSTVADPSSVSAARIEGPHRPPWRIFLGISIILIALPGAYFVWSGLRSRWQPQTEITGKGQATPKGPELVRPSNTPVLSPKSVEAHDLYLKGQYFWNKRTVTGFQQAIEYFQQATKANPNYAPAYAGLANSYTLLSAYTSVSATLYMPQARAAALRALELDENLAEAHTALALIVQNQDWDWQTSESEFRRAIELNPNYATGHQWYAEHLMWLGRFDEALRESERARRLDPLSLIIASDYGAILYFSRQYDPAIEQLRSVLQRYPTFGPAVGLLVRTYAEKGILTQALAHAETWGRVYGEGPVYWSLRAYAYGRAGHPVLARRELKKLEELSRNEQLDPATMIWAHLGVSDKEEALADMEKAYSQHFNLLTTLKVDPAFDPLRSDPRFQDLLRRVGLAN
jgi:DNA-binding winged helix-turn-helix (wHTH) protein/Tfp pilus assembly protein PilF